MKLIIGTYRKQAYINQALESIDQYVSGVSEIVFVDDSGDPEHQAWLSQFGRVVDTGRSGYNVAMKAVCAEAGSSQFCFWEEDFKAVVKFDLTELGEVLDQRPKLAQLALLRGPHFPIEHEHGGLIQALEAKGEKFELVAQPGLRISRNIYLQTATFTCNPAVWQRGIAAQGWPDGQWSEDAKRDQLLAQGYKFGFVPGIKVHHEGVRSGYGY
ncbi:glycosyltransferase [Rhodococcus sp. NPDC019627]|uniref:glycosyltransferase family 2 protein n=1 Tax=unclassified Rhodococcus (in: high G+C Gram-positive bacteria) TaxID=192944 RepID=UPI0033CB4A3F